MGDKKGVCITVGIILCVAIVAISITLIATSIRGLSATEVGQSFASAPVTLDKKNLFKQGTHTLGPFHNFFVWPTDVQSVVFDGSEEGALLECRSQDGMKITINLSFQYRIPQTLTSIVGLFENWGENNWKIALFKIARASIRDSASTFPITSFVYYRSTVTEKMIADLTSVYDLNYVTLDNFQLLDITFPDSYAEVITTTQEETIKITEATNEQIAKTTMMIGLYNAATQEQLTITQQAAAITTTEQTKYNAAVNVYTYYVPNMAATITSMKTYFDTTTPQMLTQDWQVRVGYNNYNPTTPKEVHDMFE